MTENRWREVPNKSGLTTELNYKTFVEVDDKGDRTGRMKYVFQGATAADNDRTYMFVPAGFHDATGG